MKKLLFISFMLFSLICNASIMLHPSITMTGLLQTKNEIEMIIECKELGFDGFDDNLYMKRSPLEQEQILKLKKELNLKVGAIVFFLDINRYLLDKNWDLVLEEISVELDYIINACEDLNCNNIILVPGDKLFNVSRKFQFDKTAELLRFISKYLKKRSKIILNIEAINKQEKSSRFISTQIEALELIKAVNRSNIRILFDVYHAGMNNELILEELKTCKNYIGYFHIADTNGRFEPGTGNINYKEVFKWIKENCSNVPIALEHYQKCSNIELLELYKGFGFFKSNK